LAKRETKRFEAKFQTFETQGGPAHGRERATALRARLATLDFAGFIVPRADRHQNEYVPASEERLLWLTGFSGSAGLAVVLGDEAALFVDGRYTAQAPSQIDTTVFTPVSILETSPQDWLETRLKPGQRLGYDPWLHTPEAVERFAAACGRAGAELVPLAINPIDAIWSDRPPEPLGAVTAHPSRLSGERTERKIARVQAAIKSASGVLVSDAHNVAWLFNIRGADVSHTPLPLGFAYVPKSGAPTLFLDARKLSNKMRARLTAIAAVEEPARLLDFVAGLAAAESRIGFDGATAPAILTQSFRGAGGEPVVAPDPISLMKSRKNDIELAGARAAHERDGAALARFLAWFDREAAKGDLTEIAAARALESFRRDTGRLKDISFPSIAAAGPHAAIPHYRVSEESNLRIGRGLFLIDSGAQYEDGTTDITRTIAVGKPAREARDRFTRVLKGHIAIARAVFPKGTSGAQIDSLARQALWRAGLDFDHGTGHGVGVYLSVHEGPPRIAKTGLTSLEPGMILSNEPGFYAAGRFGVRIENLVVVEPRKIEGAEREMFGFETISLAPIDLAAIDAELLDEEEIAWLDGYHARVRATISPLVDKETRAWLAGATRKLGAKAGK
jgi:Xaa-Pro aminopeptidase